MFDHKEDLRSIYLQYLKFFRMERITLVPREATLAQILQKIVFSDDKNRKFA